MKIGYAIASQSFEPQVLKGILIPYALAMNSLMSRKHSEKPWWAISLRLLQTETREAEVVRGKQSQWGFYLLGIIAAGNGMGWQPVPAKAPECSTFKTRSHFLAGAIMKMEWGNWIALICPGMVKIKKGSNDWMAECIWAPFVSCLHVHELVLSSLWWELHVSEFVSA